MTDRKIRWGKSTYGMMRYMRMIAAGHYQLKWQGDVVDIRKVKVTKHGNWGVFLNGETWGHMKAAFATLDGAMNWVDNVWGNEPVMTRNLQNPAAGEFPISRKQKGGCCDPGTELYHAM